MSQLIATFFYVGRAPFAPGTFGSLAALPVGLGIIALFGLYGLLAGIIAVFFIGWWATNQETKGQDDHDPSEIVIDEVAGQWIAMLPLICLPSASVTALIPLLASFALFRIFDILKPWPVSWADQKSTAFGVMLDDVLAGIMAAACLWLALQFIGGPA